MIWAVIWYWLLGVFTAADIITTRIALAVGFHEANPFMAPFVGNMVEMKLLFLLLTIGITYATERNAKGDGWMIPASGCCVTSGAVISNIMHLAPVLLV